MLCILVNFIHIIKIFKVNNTMCFRNREDPEGLSTEELELTEVTLEGLTAVVQHPNTHKYRNYIMKHTSNILEKFIKILQTEKTSSDPNKVVKYVNLFSCN